MIPDSYILGFDSYGSNEEDNPYDYGTLDYKNWSKGFEDAHKYAEWFEEQIFMGNISEENEGNDKWLMKKMSHSWMAGKFSDQNE